VSRVRAARAAKHAARSRSRAIRRAPAGYSGTPLPQKLGIKEQSRAVLVRAPHDFAATLGTLPAGARVVDRLTGEADVILLFCRALAELQRDFPRAQALLAERGGLWACWPKKAAGVRTDLDENAVRAVGLGHGLVDIKVCAVDSTWSGLRFARRRA
jgi:hypothetical protein